MIRILRTLMEKIDNYAIQMDTTARETEILRNNEKEMLKIKTTLSEMKNASHGLSRWETAEKGVRDLEDTSVETSQTETQREKRINMEQNTQGVWEIFKGCNTYVIRMPETEEKEQRTIFEEVAENIPS